MRILLIDADQSILNIIRFGFKITWPDVNAGCSELGEEGLVKARTQSPQLVFVGANLPDMEGTEIIKQIRLFSDVPIIALGESDDEMDIAIALESGADDYISKPFGAVSLLARTRAVIRRRSAAFDPDTIGLPPFVSSNLVIDFGTHDVILDGEKIRLTQTEYRLLCVLVRNVNALVPMTVLKRQVWEYDDFVDSSTVRKCICHLRRKLKGKSNGREVIVNERAVGYKFVKSSEPQVVQLPPMMEGMPVRQPEAVFA